MSGSETQLSRRRFLQLSGAAGAAAFLAASSTAAVSAASRGGAASRGNPNPAQEASFATDGAFRMATWIGYIDIADDGSYPSLDRFTEETGVTIDYEEVVEDNQVFFASDLQGPIEAGVPTGWDIVVLTDWMVQRLIALGWLEEIGTSTEGNFPKNLEDIYQRDWDPGNKLAAPYVSGMTGLGYDELQAGKLTSLEPLWNDQFAGQLTYLTEMPDTVGLAAIHQGNDPSTLDDAQFAKALELIKSQVDNGVVRRMTGNSYIEDLTTGDVVLAIAWSGDVAGLLYPLNDDTHQYRWVLADEGGMLWTDNMTLPKGVENKPQAERFIDWYYNPRNAGQIIASVRYVCPVKGTVEAVKEWDPTAADDPLIFPTKEMRDRLHVFVYQDPDKRAEWETAFQAAIGL
ncbi:MAG: spermidine/putrescine ABC transporter substrate-binding protein [Chloroflexota bacterium]